MFKNLVLTALLTAAIPFFSEACTGLMLKANDGSFVHGRTLEFGMKLDTSILFIPRGYEFHGTTPLGDGLTYKAKYAATGAMAFDVPSIMDGINEKGLAVGAFYFPGFAGYSDITKENQSKALAPVEFTNWIITQFSTVEEVKQGLKEVIIAKTVDKSWGDAPAPFHFIVYDKSGKSLVIEPIEGAFKVYDNPLGVITNSPQFDWHMTNLRNFINLTPFNVSPLKIDGLTLAPFGQGSGMVGLPGDFTPPSRFVRAAIFSITAIPSETSSEAVLQAFHILNQFDIPVGVAKQKVGDVIHTDYTQLTGVRDPQSLRFYFKGYEDQTIRMVDLKQLDFNGKSLLRKKISGTQKVIDLSKDLK
ncbi:linear amide C-N hydrolase [Criblamydia sequanensis]|uniref:Choloylglycine hydrolase n=1 Tax=Candidatus Criblamydia sequanensis CRIB-18 TaxID=1437425 RepID=A0A090DWL1_9BACT|nr:choloylglycine hydrolase family protein [Criblamydia sequanensis]CDR33239.1 Putative choloylglycine hydrolase [Criblamydia sequanensis CRIB-18]